MLVREGAIGPGSTDTVTHALDMDNEPMCGIAIDATEPWFPAREGGDANVTCEGCREEMVTLDEEWEEEEESEDEEG